MPVKITKVKKGYKVKTPNMVHAKHTTKKKAEKQERLLNAIEHGWKPSKKNMFKKKSFGFNISNNKLKVKKTK